MSLVSAITRCPLPHDAEASRDALGGWPVLPGDLAALLRGAAGSSPYLRRLMARERDWLLAALDADPARIVPDLVAPLSALDAKRLPDALREAKRRLALYAGLADLGGVWGLMEVTDALTRFADASVDLSLKALLAPELARDRLPGQGPDELPQAAGLTVLAMGKMGAGELNYSSDIDLICVFDDSRYPGADAGTARAAFVRVIRRMTAMLSDQTAEGYVWRTDLRLRPDPSVTPVVVAMEAAERYYESLGRTWERAAHIKARPCAGDLAAGQAYLDRLRPFVWRRHLDFAAVRDADDMRLRIRRHKGLHETGRLEGRDLKLGPGGIREIEFFCQTRQLIAGGRDPYLRVRGTLDALDRLAEHGWIPHLVANDLADHYRALREIEHRVQMVEDARTHALPATAEGIERIARLCGEGDTERFRRTLTERLRAVAGETEGFFTGGLTGAHTEPSDEEPDIVTQWLRYPALRTDRARASFERLKPDLLARLAAAANPEEALLAFDGFLSGLPAGVQLFALFEANPQLRALIVDIAATSPSLAQYLSRNSGVLDAVIDGDFFAPWPGQSALCRDLARRLSAAPDYEAQLDGARHFAREWHFRVGVHHLRGLIDGDAAGAQYADLAGAVLQALYPAVEATVAARHGPPPGRGAAVLGMGSLGAGWLNARSDLDLILVYDAPGDAVSEGRRPIAARAYFAKLTQALVTALSAATAAGKLYEVDMRLRPSGRQGPVATSLAAYASYQRDEAWTWEHLALTRARPVAGSAAVGAEADAVRAEILARPKDRRAILADVADMRDRLREARSPIGPLDLKPGPGGLREIDLMAQAAALLAGETDRDAMAQAARIGAALDVAPEDAQRLTAAHTLLRRALAAGRLLLDRRPKSLDDLAEGARTMLLRETEAENLARLEGALQEARRTAAEIADRCLPHR